MKEFDRVDLARLLDTRPMRWDQIGMIFSLKYGNERVLKDEKQIVVKFNPADAVQFEQMNRLGELALTHGVPLSSKVLENHEISFSFKRDADRKKLSELTRGINIRTHFTDNHEVQRPVMIEDPQSVLHELTEQKWKHIEQSAYGVPVLEPREYQPLDEKLRNTQVVGLGYALHAGKTKPPSPKVWLEHIGEVEKGKAPPRTVIPKRWIQRREDFNPEPGLKESLLNSFKTR